MSDTKPSTSDTKNKLTDFHMCLALSQQAIQSQLDVAWKIWTTPDLDKKTQLSDKIEIYPVNPNTGKPRSFGLTAVLGPPAINLNVPSGKQGQVQMTFVLKSGHVDYMDLDVGAPQAHPFENWTFSFVTDLDKREISLAELAKKDEAAAREARKFIEESMADGSIFGIEYLFVNLTKVDLMLSDDRNFNFSEGVPPDALTQAKVCLQSMLRTWLNGEFMLGTVVHPTPNPSLSPPTFGLTDFVFHVNANSADQSASALCYLGMFGHASRPTDVDHARSAVNQPWLDPKYVTGNEGTVAGRMLIQHDYFLDHFLVPQFERALAMTNDGSLKGWEKKVSAPARVLAFQVEETTHPKTDADLTLRWAWNIIVQIEKGTQEARITGGINAASHFYMSSFAWVKTISDWEGSNALSGKIRFQEDAGQGGADFGLKPTFTFEFEAQSRIVQTVDKGMGQDYASLTKDTVGEIFKWVSGGQELLTPRDWMRAIMTQGVTSLKTALEAALKNVLADLDGQRFIPPGGGHYTFENFHFSAETGDLVFDVLYLAPT